FVGMIQTHIEFEALTQQPTLTRSQLKQEALIETASLEDIMYYTKKATFHV
ncbi:sodium ABC transporter ATP-binding protein, partial [Bacillus cereus]|nr:sodium ABC transporter ATP-binding protein [Bacillus cereus]